MLRINASFLLFGSLEEKATVRPSEEITVAEQQEQHKYAFASTWKKENICLKKKESLAEMRPIDWRAGGECENI